MPLALFQHAAALRLTLAVTLGSFLVVAASARQPAGSIKVHGRWSIDIRDADGTLVQHREFENALTSGGAQALAQVLARTRRAGRWQIELSGNGPCTLGGQTGAEPCLILEPFQPGDPPLEPSRAFHNLTVTPANGQLLLRGHATASGSSGRSIDTVRTMEALCDLSTGACVTATFSQKSISPLSVVPGQIIQVTVALSFQ